jgi:uncharacterized protein YdhG (YjbR/CyaY superfamily)
MKIKAKNIDEYISNFPKEVQEILQQVRLTVRLAAPDAQETINYAIPTFKLHDKNLVHFAGFANHIGFYPTPSVIVKFKKELSGYESAKGSIQFPLSKKMPLKLIRKIVQFRVREMLEIQKSVGREIK